jgi:hypothetical protein
MGTAGGARGIPRIVGDTKRFTFGKGRETELRSIGAANEDRARASIARHQLAVVRGNHLLQHACAVAGRNASNGRLQVFDHHGDASKRAIRRDLREAGARLTFEHAHDRIQRWIPGGDPRERRVEGVGCRDVARTNQRGQSEAVELIELGKREGRHSVYGTSGPPRRQTACRWPEESRDDENVWRDRKFALSLPEMGSIDASCSVSVQRTLLMSPLKCPLDPTIAGSTPSRTRSL